VRKARAFEVSASFEAEARNELATMLTKIEQGQATTEQVQTQINTMMTGYGKSLAQVDPEASLKFRATIATAGNTVLAKAAEAETKRAKQQRLIKFDQDFDASVRLLEAAVSQGFWVDQKTGTKRSVDDLADVYRQTISTSALLMGDATLQKSYSDKFETALKSAKIGAVSSFVTAPEFSADPEAGLALIRSGNVGKMTDVYKAMPFEDQAKVMANYMVAINQRETLVKNNQAVAKRDGEIQLAGLMQQLYAAPQGSPAQRAIQSRIVGLAQTVPGVVSDSTLKSILEPKQAKSDPMVEFNVVTGILNGTITTADQVKNYIGRGLTGNDAVSALKLINSESRRDQSEIERGINRLAGINQTGGIVVLDKNAMEFTNRQQLKAQSLDIEARLLREGKQPTPAMVVAELEKFVTERRSSETAKQAVDALKVYEKKDWINGPVTMDSLAALERKAGTDRTRQNDVKRIRSLLQQANGMTQ
jgi:RNase H-fold protein (predicted Holliday junction resolvase)